MDKIELDRSTLLYLNGVLKNNEKYSVSDIPRLLNILLYSYVNYNIVKLVSGMFNYMIRHGCTCYLGGMHALEHMYNIETHYEHPFEFYIDIVEQTDESAKNDTSVDVLIKEYVMIPSRLVVPQYIITLLLNSNLIQQKEKCIFVAKVNDEKTEIDILVEIDGKYGIHQAVVYKIYINTVYEQYYSELNMFGNPNFESTNKSYLAFCNLYSFYYFLKENKTNNKYQDECLSFLNKNFYNPNMYTLRGLSALCNKPSFVEVDIENLKKQVEENLNKIEKNTKTIVSSRLSLNKQVSYDRNFTLSINNTMEGKQIILENICKIICENDPDGILQFYTYISDSAINEYLKDKSNNALKPDGYYMGKITPMLNKNAYRIYTSVKKEENTDLEIVKKVLDFMTPGPGKKKPSPDEMKQLSTSANNIISSSDLKYLLDSFYQVDINTKSLSKISNNVKIPNDMNTVCEMFCNRYNLLNGAVRVDPIFNNISESFVIYRASNIMPMFTEHGFYFDPNFIKNDEDMFIHFPSYLSCSHSSDFSLDMFMRQYSFLMKIRVNKNSKNWLVIDKYSYFNDRCEYEVLLKAGTILKYVSKEVGIVESNCAKMKYENKKYHNAVLTTDIRKENIVVLNFEVFDNVDDIKGQKHSAAIGGGTKIINCLGMSNTMINIIKNNNKNAIVRNYSKEINYENNETRYIVNKNIYNN